MQAGTLRQSPALTPRNHAAHRSAPAAARQGAGRRTAPGSAPDPGPGAPDPRRAAPDPRRAARDATRDAPPRTRDAARDARDATRDAALRTRDAALRTRDAALRTPASTVPAPVRRCGFPRRGAPARTRSWRGPPAWKGFPSCLSVCMAFAPRRTSPGATTPQVFAPIPALADCRCVEAGGGILKIPIDYMAMRINDTVLGYSEGTNVDAHGTTGRARARTGGGAIARRGADFTGSAGRGIRGKFARRN